MCLLHNPMITGSRQLDRTLSQLASKLAPQVARSAVSAGLFALARAARSVQSSKTRIFVTRSISQGGQTVTGHFAASAGRIRQHQRRRGRRRRSAPTTPTISPRAALETAVKSAMGGVAHAMTKAAQTSFRNQLARLSNS